MSPAIRNISTTALLAVVAAHALSGNAWTLGLAFFALNMAFVLAKNLASVFSKRLLVLALALGAATALAVQAVSVLQSGQLGRAAGILPHANTAAAATVAMLVLLAVCLDIVTKGIMREAFARFAIVLACAVAAGLVFASGSRSLLIGLAFGGAVMMVSRFWRTRDSRFWYWLTALIGIVLLALMVVARLRPDLTAALSAFERGPIFLTGLRMAALSPWVGHGQGAWLRLVSIVEPSLPPAAAVHAHSLPLELLIGGGAIGLVAVAVLVLAGVRWLATKSARHNSFAASVAMVGLVGLAVQSLADLAVLHPAVYAPLVVALLVWVASVNLQPAKAK